MLDEFFFAWDGANHPDGPFLHLRVLEIRGHEAMSTLSSFEVELVRPPDAPDVDPTDLIGRRCALRFVTRTTPASRLIHGVIVAAEELGEIENGTRYRVDVAPPLARAAMMKKSIIYLEKTIKQIIEEVLTRTALGAGLELNDGRELEEDDGDASSFQPATATFTWRVIDEARIMDPKVRPYCVQYDETDFAFVSRLLEEEGIAYHFEHGKGECLMVMSDFDGGRTLLRDGGPVGPGILGREVLHWHSGVRLRPRSVAMLDFSWQKPALDLGAVSPAGITDFMTFEQPGRYEVSKETGEILARKREERLDTEREYVSAEGRFRALSAGSVIELEHPTAKLNGEYLVVSVRHVVRQRGSFSAGSTAPPYENRFECIRRGARGAPAESRFRPQRVTPRPRIVGSQTAIVTADPSAPGAEINVGGPADIGCVRVRFHWDVDIGRLTKEPSSCFVRVSQFFAGASHGALWNPRVGHEVIVDFLDGDPDRPIITGRVYNGANLSPHNATAKPTISAIKSLTSPEDGTFNAIVFEDAAGQQEIAIHASRDMTTTVTRDASRSVGLDDKTTVSGSQSVSVTGGQSTSAGSISMGSGSVISLDAKTTVSAHAGVDVKIQGGSIVSVRAPCVDVGATTIKMNAGGTLEAKAPTMTLAATGKLSATAPTLEAGGGAVVRVGAVVIEVIGSGVVIITSPAAVVVRGAVVDVEGGVVNVKGGGAVNLTGSSVNLNC